VTDSTKFMNKLELNGRLMSPAWT